MVNIYVRKIKAGGMTVDEVPVRWRSGVVAALAALAQ